MDALKVEVENDHHRSMKMIDYGEYVKGGYGITMGALGVSGTDNEGALCLFYIKMSDQY